MLDPEVPVLTIEDLGVLRDVAVDADGRVEVTITPTYSGCPAMDAIRDDIVAALHAERLRRRVACGTVLSPAWTTDWMSDAGTAQAARVRHRAAAAARRRSGAADALACAARSAARPTPAS